MKNTRRDHASDAANTLPPAGTGGHQVWLDLARPGALAWLLEPAGGLPLQKGEAWLSSLLDTTLDS